jgi:hypothetical protein
MKQQKCKTGRRADQRNYLKLMLLPAALIERAS